MARKRTPKKRDGLLVRAVEISSAEAHITGLVQHKKGGGWENDVRSWLRLEGRADEPVGDVSDVEISLRAEEKETIEASSVACVGVVVNVRPVLSAVIGLPQDEYARAWTLAANDRLSHARLAFTKPHYGTAYVKSFSLSNRPIE